jgi:hypothetical protein
MTLSIRPLDMKMTPPRRGWLRHGNLPGDYAKAPRCGTKTRAGGCCRQPAMKNGRCRMHGGLSTGPRTAEGLARARQARWKHGFDSAEIRSLRREAAHAARKLAASVRLARAELSRRRAAAGRARTAAASSGDGASSLGMGSIEWNRSTAGVSSGGLARRIEQASHRGSIRFSETPPPTPRKGRGT